ncbi:MAG TPA: FxSxx-COOH system tetratricopeptide repeat protein [Streptosporangiaceae bacterium]
MGGDNTDFFISHAGADRAWAEWVAWQLIDAGYSVELDVWDWAAGQNFVTKMSDALDRAGRVIALFSAAYFERERYTTEEWSSSVLHLPGMTPDWLIPVRVEEIPAGKVPAVLRPLQYRDVFGVDEPTARRRLLKAVADPKRPDRPPEFPGRPGGLGRLGGTGPRRPGTTPRVWNVPARNPAFTGRDGLLVTLRERLLSGDRAVVQALHGMGGVGKTQLVIEYGHRFTGTYDLVWWIDSEQGGLIGERFAALGSELSCVPTGASREAMRSAVLGELRERGRWLLVFDNAENPDDVRPWLPGGGGHVLITSRERGWDDIAVPVEVDVLARAESVAMLRERVAGLGEPDAHRLAEELGDLPLAIAQAAGFMAETGMPAGQYLDLLRSRAGEILARGPTGAYPRSLAAVVDITVGKLAAEDPAAAALANLCAFFGPEPIPENLLTCAPNELPPTLAERTADPLAWRQTLARLSRRSLARIDQRGVQLHRLVQAILRDRLTPAEAFAMRTRATAMLVAADPGDTQDPSTWPRWAQLMPHVLANDLGAAGAALRELAWSACYYLLARGDARTCHDLARDLHSRWRERLGDGPDVQAMAHCLAWALQELGRYSDARDLALEALTRDRRVLGDNHPDTLASANNLAVDLRALGEIQAARELDEDILARHRRTLGDNHPSTLTSANNLGVDLQELGDYQAARELNEDTLARYRRLVGDNHPSTLISAHNLAHVLRALGEIQAARELDEDTLARYRRVLGDDHPDTLMSANNLAADLRRLGDYRAARDLDEDTLIRRRRILGDDHPDTQLSVHNLASDLRALGEGE